MNPALPKDYGRGVVGEMNYFFVDMYSFRKGRAG